MIKKLFGCMDRKYIKYTVATPLTMLLEVSMEVALPFLIQLLIDNGINTRNVGYVMAVGGIMAERPVRRRSWRGLCKGRAAEDVLPHSGLLLPEHRQVLNRKPAHPYDH